MKDFNGNILFLDRANINTDEIIPAHYLTEITKEALKDHLLEDLNLDRFNLAMIADSQVIVTRANFGCGSSREHAVWALEVNDINLVLAPGFARIFRQNMYNCGMMAVELAEADIERLFASFDGQPAHVETDLAAGRLTVTAADKSETIPFELSGFDRKLVEAGGWVDYADSRY